MDLNSQFINEIQEFQDNLYCEKGGKNIFFKKTQKNEIAKSVSENFELSRLLFESIYISSENEIYINYPTLKLFIHEEIYENIIDHLLNLFNETILKYGNYSFNLNLEGFTVSAAERHKNVIILFSNKCLNNTSIEYSILVNKIRILNTPSIINILIKMFKPFFPKNITNQIEYFNKQESVDIIKKLEIR